MSGTAIPVLGIVFFATFIRSAFGFGEALVAVPLLVLYLPLTIAAPLAVLISITIAAVSSYRTGARFTFGARGGSSARRLWEFP